MGNRALYVILRLFAAVIKYIPLTVAYGLADACAYVAFHVVRSARSGIQGNLAVVLNEPRNSPAVRRASREAFRTDAKNWVDTLRIAHLETGDLLGLVDLDGWEHVEASLNLGRGLIVVALHLGNFDLVGQVFAARGLKAMIPVERVEPPELFDFLTSRRRSQGINVVPMEKAPRAILSALKRGEVVGIAGDRSMGGKTIVLPFFGKGAPISTAPATLARRHQVPVVIAVGTRMATNRFHGVIQPVPLTFTDDEAHDLRANTLRIVALMEPIIHRHVGQWLVFSPIWQADTGIGHAATIGQRTGAAR